MKSDIKITYETINGFDIPRTWSTFTIGTPHSLERFKEYKEITGEDFLVKHSNLYNPIKFTFYISALYPKIANKIMHRAQYRTMVETQEMLIDFDQDEKYNNMTFEQAYNKFYTTLANFGNLRDGEFNKINEVLVRVKQHFVEKLEIPEKDYIVKDVDGFGIPWRQLSEEELNQDITFDRIDDYHGEVGEDFLDQHSSLSNRHMVLGFMLAKFPEIAEEILKEANSRYGSANGLYYSLPYDEGEAYEKFYTAYAEFCNLTVHTKRRVNQILVQILEHYKR